MRKQIVPGRFPPPPAKNGLGKEARSAQNDKVSSKKKGSKCASSGFILSDILVGNRL